MARLAVSCPGSCSTIYTVVISCQIYRIPYTPDNCMVLANPTHTACWHAWQGWPFRVQGFAVRYTRAYTYQHMLLATVLPINVLSNVVSVLYLCWPRQLHYVCVVLCWPRQLHYVCCTLAGPGNYTEVTKPVCNCAHMPITHDPSLVPT